MNVWAMTSRRIFTKMAGLAIVAMALPRTLGAYFMDTLGVRTVEKSDFEFRDGLIVFSDGRPSLPWQLEIDGLVERPLTLSWQEVRALPQVTQVSDFHCVEGWSVKDITWGGLRPAEIVSRVKPRAAARYVILHALGETASEPRGQEYYIECLPLEHLLDAKQECLLALTMNGRPLPHDHGAPLRLIAPYDLAYKSIKYIRRIEFSDREISGWWTLANPVYPRHAPVPARRLRQK